MSLVVHVAALVSLLSYTWLRMCLCVVHAADPWYTPLRRLGMLSTCRCTVFCPLRMHYLSSRPRCIHIFSYSKSAGARAGINQHWQSLSLSFTSLPFPVSNYQELGPHSFHSSIRRSDFRTLLLSLADWTVVRLSLGKNTGYPV